MTRVSDDQARDNDIEPLTEIALAIDEFFESYGPSQIENRGVATPGHPPIYQAG